MRMCTLQNLYDCLQNESNEIHVDESIAKDAIRPIQRMLEMSWYSISNDGRVKTDTLNRLPDD